MRPITSVSSHTVQSAPTTPASAGRRPSVSEYLAKHLDRRRTVTPTDSPLDNASNWSYAPSLRESTDGLDVPGSASAEDPIDREGLSSTPLLPPLLSNHWDPSDEGYQSPLQSPSVASYSETASLANFSVYSPATSNLPTPPLSAKPSMTNFNRTTTAYHLPLEPDHWAMKLGHANFDIDPKPYTPQHCTRDACQRLLEDWESARLEYMRVAARVSEHYGPSSPIYKLTEEKWAEIDKEWRSNLERANVKAEANGEVPISACLAETQALAKMPSLVDPHQPAKFLNVDEADIVGPMVQYVKIQQPPSPKRLGLFSLLKEPSSLFGRSPFGARR